MWVGNHQTQRVRIFGRQQALTCKAQVALGTWLLDSNPWLDNWKTISIFAYLCATFAIEKWLSTKQTVNIYIPMPMTNIEAPSNSRTTRLSVTYATKTHLTSSSRCVPHQAAEGQTLVAEGSHVFCRRVPLEGLRARRKYKRVHHRLTPNAITIRVNGCQSSKKQQTTNSK